MPEYEIDELYEEYDPIAERDNRKSKRLHRRHQFKRHQKKHADIADKSSYLSAYVRRTGAKNKTFYVKRSMGSKFLKKESSKAFRRDKTGNSSRRSFFKKTYDYWWNLW